MAWSGSQQGCWQANECPGLAWLGPAWLLQRLNIYIVNDDDDEDNDDDGNGDGENDDGDNYVVDDYIDNGGDVMRPMRA